MMDTGENRTRARSRDSNRDVYSDSSPHDQQEVYAVWKAVKFLKEFYSHWLAAWLGTISVIAAIILWATGAKQLSWAGLAALAFVCVIAASFQIWDKLTTRLQTEERLQNAPRLFLEYAEGPNGFIGSDKSGLSLRTEGEKRVANVRITSDEAVGVNRTRLAIEWENPLGYIGPEAVPLNVKFVYTQDGATKPAGGPPCDQIKDFLGARKLEPSELIVTVNYTDVLGRPCPPRKFLISKESNLTRKILGIERISCQPIADQAV